MQINSGTSERLSNADGCWAVKPLPSPSRQLEQVVAASRLDGRTTPILLGRWTLMDVGSVTLFLVPKARLELRIVVLLWGLDDVLRGEAMGYSYTVLTRLEE